jgi:hypothetical protein
MTVLYELAPLGDARFVDRTETAGTEDMYGHGLDRFDADILTVIGEESDAAGLSVSDIGRFLVIYQRSGNTDAIWPSRLKDVLRKVHRHVEKMVRTGDLHKWKGAARDFFSGNDDIVFLDDYGNPIEDDRQQFSGPGASNVLESLGFKIEKRSWEGLSDREIE